MFYLLAFCLGSIQQQPSAFIAPDRLMAAAPPVSVLLNHGPSTSGGGSSTISGETLALGRWSLDWRTDWTDYENVSVAEAEALAAANGEFDGLGSSLVSTLAIAYGLTADLQLAAQAGWYQGSDFLDAEADGLGGAESAGGDPSGITDLWLSGKYRLLRGSRGNLAVLAGVKLPTGADGETLSNGEVLEPSSQPGSGATDFQAGFGYSRFLTTATTLDASALFTLRGEHQDFSVGDRVDLGVAVAHRLSGGAAAAPGWTVFGEVLAVALGKDEEGSEANGNSGGTIFFFSPGLRYRCESGVAITLAPSIPVVQDWNGEQIETDLKLTCTVSFDW